MDLDLECPAYGAEAIVTLQGLREALHRMPPLQPRHHMEDMSWARVTRTRPLKVLSAPPSATRVRHADAAPQEDTP